MESSEIDLSEFNDEVNDSGVGGGGDAQPSPAAGEPASANTGEIAH